LFYEANNIEIGSFKVKELSLSGNMEAQEMLNRKIKWKTVDDDKTEYQSKKMDYKILSGNKVELVPQRIRVFEITVDPTTSFL
jgi:hypothetical protein